MGSVKNDLSHLHKVARVIFFLKLKMDSCLKSLGSDPYPRPQGRMQCDLCHLILGHRIPPLCKCRSHQPFFPSLCQALSLLPSMRILTSAQMSLPGEGFSNSDITLHTIF